MQQSALRSLGIICDYTLYGNNTLCGCLQFVIRDGLPSYGNQRLWEVVAYESLDHSESNLTHVPMLVQCLVKVN